MSDSLYGMQPDPAENFGVNLGAIAPRGERNTLIVSLDALLRMSSTPFFPYTIERIERGTAAKPPIKAATRLNVLNARARSGLGARCRRGRIGLHGAGESVA